MTSPTLVHPELASLRLKGPTSTADYDAQVSVPDGGSENYQGTYQIQAAATQIAGYDASILVRIVSVPGATDVVGLDAGNNGSGATVYAYNASSTNSNLNLVAQGTGDINVASGAGVLLNVNSPTLPVSNTITITPGAGSTNAGAASIVVGSGAGECGLTLLTTTYAAGMAFGPSGINAPTVTNATDSYAFGQNASISGGSHTFCFGYYAQAHGSGNFVCGSQTRDNGRKNTFFGAAGTFTGLVISNSC